MDSGKQRTIKGLRRKPCAISELAFQPGSGSSPVAPAKLFIINDLS